MGIWSRLFHNKQHPTPKQTKQRAFVYWQLMPRCLFLFHFGSICTQGSIKISTNQPLCNQLWSTVKRPAAFLKTFWEYKNTSIRGTLQNTPKAIFKMNSFLQVESFCPLMLRSVDLQKFSLQRQFRKKNHVFPSSHFRAAVFSYFSLSKDNWANTHQSYSSPNIGYSSSSS